jgi:ribosomal protein S18 acetylase RimI-like enzyme
MQQSRIITHFRLRPATLEDLPEAVEMFNACSRESAGKDEFDLEDYRNEWSDPSIDLAADTRVAQTPDGAIVGCIEVWNTSPYVNCWIWGRVHPTFCGQGIGSALMDWAEERARLALERAPAGTKITLEVGTISSHLPTTDLFADRGYHVARHSLTMERALDMELPAPVWPTGITVRPMRPGDELAVYRVQNESFRDHWGHIEVPEEQGYALWRHRTIEDPNHDPSLWFLALDGDEIAGVALCDAFRIGEPDMGWVSALGVRRPWRRRGLAEALLYHSFTELRRRGRTHVGLGVDASSLTGATRLYEKVGMRATRTFALFAKELRPGRYLTTQAVEQ